ncbi:MAG: hypothetical protein CMF99_01505 [Candidatus Marinimicrobia bacterium]|nr:hypothetical protein [Candidatus Neomarinimicrobiota bacterium]|tara:strand:+ start:2736 stop:3776 length:1041 start_codon:yes stop_codon:yes gene_type:complete
MRIHFKTNKILHSIPRKFYADWIKPLFPDLRHDLYGIRKKDLILSLNPKKADILILPLTWNYYFQYGKTNEANEILKYYEMIGKPIVTWVSGDYTHRVIDGNFILLQQNLYESKRKNNEYAYPVIIRDPFDYLKFYGVNIASGFKKPSISFCGTANWTLLDRFESILKEFFFRIKNKVFKRYLDLSFPISGLNLRGELLKVLDQNANLDTHLIIRKRGDSSLISKEKYKFEYWNNILLAPFTICVRGNGNFSVRFYETLALGRIPILIDTDCVLPLDNEINWQNHCIIIKHIEPNRIVDYVNLSINAMDDNDIINMQMANRKLWVDKLSFSGFYYGFTKNILKNNI